MARGRWIGAGAALAVAVVAFVLLWFEPQQLLIDERVDAPLPTVPTAPSSTTPSPSPTSASTSTSPAGPTTTVPSGPVDVAGGSFVSLDHGTTGAVRVLELADTSRVVRLEGLDTDNGPDLYLYLSTNPAGGEEGAFDDDFVDLGPLQGNLGDQNYELPAGTDLTRYRSIVIWCDRFDSAFGAADLLAA